MNKLTVTFALIILPLSIALAQVNKVGELKDISGKITQFQIDNTNKYIATGNEIGILTVWDFASREELFKVRPHREAIKFIIYFSDKKQIISLTDNEIAFVELEDGTQSSKINIFENIDWVDINNATGELYVLANRKATSGSKSIYFVNLESRKFDVFHSSVKGIESFKTTDNGKTMYIAKGDEVLVKNISLDLIDKKLQDHEGTIQTIDINPSKPNWLVSTDKYTIKYWKLSSGNKYSMKWKPAATPEDFDKILNAWVLNEDNKILIHGEDGFKIRDVTNPKNETEITSFIGLDVKKIKLSPDKTTILLQTGNHTLGIYSNGEAAAEKPTEKIADKSAAPSIIESTDEIYAKYKTEIDVELNLRAELFEPRGEFERSVDYEGRKAEADSYKAGILAYYKGLANRDAEVQIELALAHQKILDDKAKRDSERRASLYRDKIKKSYSEFFTKISGLGTYNADTEVFPITIDGITHNVNVPFDKAREFKTNYNFCKVVGNQQYLEDATTMDKFNYRIVTDNKEVYKFGTQRKPLFVESNRDLMFNSIVGQKMVAKTAVVASPTINPSSTTGTSAIDQRIIDYFRNKTYHALLIGVSEYRDHTITQLDGPVNDALRLKRVLKEKYTFEEENITLLKNPTRTEIIETFDRLQQTIGTEDNLLIFYAGHGIWDEKLRQGFWLPSDAKRDSKAAWLSNARIRDYIGGIKTKHTLLVADACFSGGIFKSREVFSKNRASLELAKLPSRKAITSGAMKTVPDKSVFIEYLVKRLDQNEKDLLPTEQLFSSFKIAVMNNSEGQVPQFGDIKGAGDEGGDFIFLKRQ